MMNCERGRLLSVGSDREIVMMKPLIERASSGYF